MPTSWKNLVNTARTRTHEVFRHVLLDRNELDCIYLMTAFICLEYTIYLLWALGVVIYTPVHQHINMTLFVSIFPCIVVTLFVFFALAMIARQHRESPSILYGVQVAIIILYLLALFTMGYAVGYTSLMTGIALIGTSILALMLLDRSLVYWSLFGSSTLLIAILVAVSAGILPDAPLIVHSDQLHAFWILSFIYFGTPKMMAIFIIVDAAMKSMLRNYREVTYLSQHDALTGLWNRRTIQDYTLKKMSNNASSISLVLLDLDFFKHVNDTYGHPAGDAVLVAVSNCIRSELREHDRVSRFGGEEYLVVLPKTTEDEACRIAERLRARIESTPVKIDDGQQIDVTASFGVASLCSSVAESLEKHPEQAQKFFARLFELADKALYVAKTSGRNQVSRALVQLH